jgi:hypothetical protein
MNGIQPNPPHVDPGRGEIVLLVFDASRAVILENLAQLTGALGRPVGARPGRRRGRDHPAR